MLWRQASSLKKQPKLLSLPAWVLQEKIQARREKKERMVERKKQLEKFLVNELLVNPGLSSRRKTGIDQRSLRRRRRKENASDPNPEARLGRPLKKTHMRRFARSPRSNVLIKYASARRFFARLASEIFLSDLQNVFAARGLINLQKDTLTDLKNVQFRRPTAAKNP